MAAATIKRRSTRQMASRKRSRYVDPDTDDDLMTASDSEQSTELPRELDNAPAKRLRTTKSHRPETRSKSNARDKARTTRPKRRDQKTRTVVIGKPLKARGESSRKNVDIGKFSGPSDGVIPPWQTLPPDILKDIFFFGCQPLTASNVTWIINAARTCRAFMEPALEALYQWPAIWSPMHLHKLLELLRKDGRRLIRYNTKIKRLDIDVRRLAYTAHNKSLFQLGELLEEVPTLQHLEIVHPVHEPPYRDMRLMGWDYQPGIFQSLNTSHIRLTAWRWSKDMLKHRPGADGYAYMAMIHETPAFENIRELTVCGFDHEAISIPLTPDEESGVTIPDLWTAIAKLKHIKDISFISCSVVREQAMTKLPAALERLELSNCQEVNSDVLAYYLIASGSHLKDLVLYHNPALDLAFLPGLKAHCPRLETLEMSLNFYSEYQVVNDAEPLYDELLQADEIPTWPSTMRSIDIQHMQKWSGAGAVNLFQSLIDAAEELSDLRFIVLHSHINLPWRDRASFRDQWIDKLQRVFRRPYRAPDPHNNSKRQFRLWKEQQHKSIAQIDRLLSDSTLAPSVETTDEQPARLQRRSHRVAAVSATPVTTSTAVEEMSSEDESNHGHGQTFVQGLCDVVDIRIDNQRPRENQFTERDFLDSEASGDEDWNENAEGAGVDDGYAW